MFNHTGFYVEDIDKVLLSMILIAIISLCYINLRFFTHKVNINELPKQHSKLMGYTLIILESNFDEGAVHLLAPKLLRNTLHDLEV